MRQIDDGEVGETLQAVGIGTLSMVDGDQPYGIPVPFGYDDGEINFLLQTDRGAESRKLAALAENARVCLTVVDEEQEPEVWRSVVVTGELIELPVDDEGDAVGALADNATFAPGYSVVDAPAENVDIHVFRLEPTEISGREFSDR
jgi:Predicted flavin-nucleotide-binding protein